MDIRLEVAFQEAMEEMSELNRRIIMQRCIIKQRDTTINNLKQTILWL